MNNRYEVRYGKFGAYFFDTKIGAEMDLKMVADTLNRLEHFLSKRDRAVDTLADILQAHGNECESFTTGLGSCYKEGRTNSFTEETGDSWNQACDSCMAHKALEG